MTEVPLIFSLVRLCRDNLVYYFKRSLVYATAFVTIEAIDSQV